MSLRQLPQGSHREHLEPLMVRQTGLSPLVHSWVTMCHPHPSAPGCPPRARLVSRTTSLVAAWPTCGGIRVKSPDLVTSGENLPCLMSFSSSTRNGALCKSRAYTSRAPFVDLVVTKDEAVIWCSTISAEHHKRCGLASMWCEPIRYEVRALLKNSTKPFANLC